MSADSEFKYLLPLSCCKEIEAGKIPYSCPLISVFNAPDVMVSDLISVVCNPSGETVTVECRDQDPKTPREESFSIVTDCQVAVGNTNVYGQGAYIQTGFRWALDEGAWK